MKPKPGRAGSAIARTMMWIESKRCESISSKYDIAGRKRIYHIHNRKTAGTSLNTMFIALAGGDPGAIYDRLAEETRHHRIIRNGKVYVGWNESLINEGNYFYAFSHIPFHRLNLPDRTFTVTCFRDPAERVISHYRMLCEYRARNIAHPCMKIEGRWLGRNFSEFLDNLPDEHLLNQLYMFSSNLDVEESCERIINLSHFMFMDRYEEGVAQLSRKTGIDLVPVHTRKSKIDVEIAASDRGRLRSMLEKEYLLFGKLAQSPGGSSGK